MADNECATGVGATGVAAPQEWRRHGNGGATGVSAPWEWRTTNGGTNERILERGSRTAQAKVGIDEIPPLRKADGV